jgi:protein-tyrosine phosphatase
MKVLFVCTGNVCRSPMAEGFLRDQSERRGLTIDVRSTGTHAWTGRAATIDGRRVMAELGVPIDNHRTLELDRALIDWADLAICMATEHVRETKRAFPDAGEKTFTLKGFLEILPSLPDCEDTVAWLSAASARQHEAEALSPPAADVDDPFGERETAYRRVALEIRDLVERLAQGLQEKRVGAQT